MKKIKLLYITNLPSPYTIEFLNKLNENFDLFVVFERKFSLDRTKKWFAGNFKFKHTFLKGLNIGNENSFKPVIIKYLFKPFDIYFANYDSFTGMFFYLFKKLFFSKKIFFHKIDGHTFKNRKGLILIFKKFLMNTPTLHFSPSKNIDQYLISMGIIPEKIRRYNFSSITNQKYHNILTQINDKNLYNLRNKLNIPVDSKVLLYVGRFTYRKRLNILFDLINILPSDFFMIFIGGQTDQFTKRIIEKNIFKSNIKLIEYLNFNDLTEYYLAANYLVLNPLFEPWGLVVNEALAHGLKVITNSRCNAGIEMVGNSLEYGLVIDFDNSGNIQFLKNTITNLDFSFNISEKFRISNSFINYTIDNMVNHISKNIYEYFKF